MPVRRDRTAAGDKGTKNVGIAQKCTLCYDRLDAGQQPACAQACPTESIQFGDVDELRERARTRVDKLHEAGIMDARLYGDDPNDGVGGAGAFFLLLDEPEVYGFPRTRWSPRGTCRTCSTGPPWRPWGCWPGLPSRSWGGADEPHRRPLRRSRRWTPSRFSAARRKRNLAVTHSPAQRAADGVAEAVAKASSRWCPRRSSPPTTAAQSSSPPLGRPTSRRTSSPVASPRGRRCWRPELT
ncbi:MAG: 4Fe-4S dicluster domain-containing protein [Nocardioidaceae bacterium]